MRCEIPEPKRCCCCFPLRPGLLVWAYFKLIMHLILLVYTIDKLVEIEEHFGPQDFWLYIYSATVISIVTIDVVFHIILIISAHKKEYRKMRIFYRYSIVIFCLAVTCTLLLIAVYIYMVIISAFILLFFWYFIILIMGMIFVGAVLQSYLIFLIRSEMMKLKNDTQFQFVNLSADPQCTLQVDVVKEKIDI